MIFEYQNFQGKKGKKRAAYLVKYLRDPDATLKGRVMALYESLEVVRNKEINPTIFDWVEQDAYVYIEFNYLLNLNTELPYFKKFYEKPAKKESAANVKVSSAIFFKKEERVVGFLIGSMIDSIMCWNILIDPFTKLFNKDLLSKEEVIKQAATLHYTIFIS